MRKLVAILIGLFLLQSCISIVKSSNLLTHSENRDLSTSSSQAAFIYHRIVNKWQGITQYSKFPLHLTARVQLYYTPDGQLRYNHFESPSGDPQFDQELDQAIKLCSNLGTEIPLPIEITLTFYQPEMVQKNHRSRY